MSAAKEQLIDFLRDREFRGYFTEDQAYELLAIQIRQLREKYGWTQAQLGERAGMVQAAISRAENPNYRGTTISTLAKLAKAFDVAVTVRLAPFSELVDWVAQLSEASFEPASFDEEMPGTQLQLNTACAAASVLSAAEQYGIIDFDDYKNKLMTQTDECSSVVRPSTIEKRYANATA